MADDHLERLDDRSVPLAVAPELQHLQEADEPAPVVPGVGGPEGRLHGETEGGTGALELGDEVPKRRLAAGHRREDRLPHGLIGMFDRGVGHVEEDRLLAGDLAELRQEFLGDLLLRPSIYAVHCGDQQLDESVGDFLLPGMHQRRQQRQLEGPGVVLQVRGGLDRCPGPRPTAARGFG